MTAASRARQPAPYAQSVAAVDIAERARDGFFTVEMLTPRGLVTVICRAIHSAVGFGCDVGLAAGPLVAADAVASLGLGSPVQTLHAGIGGEAVARSAIDISGGTTQGVVGAENASIGSMSFGVPPKTGQA